MNGFGNRTTTRTTSSVCLSNKDDEVWGGGGLMKLYLSLSIIGDETTTTQGTCPFVFLMKMMRFGVIVVVAATGNMSLHL